uniref:SEFIR domain-containing protein n=1 Tax=Fundulus heteroclitus TaxID=8078 RepID=A0A3Q2R474_FUNHE
VSCHQISVLNFNITLCLRALSGFMKTNHDSLGINANQFYKLSSFSTGSITYLNGTWIIISGRSPYACEYRPSFTKEWFYILEEVTYGSYVVKVFNIPLPPKGNVTYSKIEDMWVPKRKQIFSKMYHASPVPIKLPKLYLKFIGNLSKCPFYLLSPDKIRLSFSRYETIPVAPMASVSVVVVYPAETPAFQRAVVALAEFLQWHGGCRVAIDMWQQEKIAELGPLRWLTERVKSADRVLIIAPQLSSLPKHSTPTKSHPEHSIPAAAHDLYPLILNMVASHAMNPTELARFWVLQLHAHKDKKSGVSLPELQACRAFCLMKDLNRLCKNLHAHKSGGKKIFLQLFKPEIYYNQNSAAKLREAIDMLNEKKPGLSDGILKNNLC